jgi:hypothetical protein
MLEAAAKPTPGDQPGEAEQIEARARPDVLGTERQAGADGEPIQPDIGDAVELALKSKGEAGAERAMPLARASRAADAGAMERGGGALTLASLYGPAVPEDGEPLAPRTLLSIHASPPAPPPHGSAAGARAERAQAAAAAA